jgi:hypothetical protein
MQTLRSWGCWLTPGILATQEAEIRKTAIQISLGKEFTYFEKTIT